MQQLGLTTIPFRTNRFLQYCGFQTWSIHDTHVFEYESIHDEHFSGIRILVHSVSAAQIVRLCSAARGTTGKRARKYVDEEKQLQSVGHDTF